MALNFAPTGSARRVDHGDVGIVGGPNTWLFVFRPGTIDGSTFRLVWSCSDGGGNRFVSIDNIGGYGGAGSLRFSWGSHDYYSVGSVFAAGTTYLVAVTFDAAAAAGSHVRLYTGTLGSDLAEVTYALQTDGTTPSAAGVTSWMGNYDAGGGLSCDGDLSRYAIYSEALTLAQINEIVRGGISSWQRSTALLVGDPRTTGAVLDYSGNGKTGTVTDATASEHAPLRRWGAAKQRFAPVAVGGGLSVPVAMHSYRRMRV